MRATEIQTETLPARLRQLSADEKLEAIMHEAQHVSSTKLARTGGVSVLENIVLALWSADVSEKTHATWFFSVRRESDLLAPVVNWLKTRGLEVYKEIPLGRNKTDVLGYKGKGLISFFSPTKIVSVELKNDLNETKRAADQLTSYRQYSSETYIACTPDVALENVKAISDGVHVKNLMPSSFDDKIKSMGCGVLIVEGDDVYVHVEAPAYTPKDFAVDEVLSAIKRRKPL